MQNLADAQKQHTKYCGDAWRTCAWLHQSFPEPKVSKDFKKPRSPKLPKNRPKAQDECDQSLISSHQVGLIVIPFIKRNYRRLRQYRIGLIRISFECRSMNSFIREFMNRLIILWICESVPRSRFPTVLIQRAQNRNGHIYVYCPMVIHQNLWIINRRLCIIHR